MTESEHDWGTYGPVELAHCEFCERPADECECEEEGYYDYE